MDDPYLEADLINEELKTLKMTTLKIQTAGLFSMHHPTQFALASQNIKALFTEVYIK